MMLIIEVPVIQQTNEKWLHMIFFFVKWEVKGEIKQQLELLITSLQLLVKF